MVNVCKIKGKLKENNMTQKELAEAIKVDPSTLNKKINEISGETLTIKEAEEIGKALSIPYEELQDYFFCQST